MFDASFADLHALSLATAVVTSMSCTPARGPSEVRATDDVVGTYRLVSLEESGGTHCEGCTGSLVLTREGVMSVQVMYRDAEAPAGSAPVQYAQGGYEASFGRFTIDEPGKSFTYRIEGALVRPLVGKEMKRLYELSGNRLVIRPPRTDEHWRATWERAS